MALNETTALLLVALAAAVLPSLSRLLRIPNPVLEILFGVLLGQSGLDIRFRGEWLPFLANLGFLLLMFQAGMEIDFGMIRQQSRSRLVFHLVVFGVTVGLSLGFSLAFGHGVFMALVLSTTSLGLVMPSLREMGLNRTPHGQAVLIAATLADFLTLLGITFFVLWSDYGPSWRLIAPLPLFLGFGLGLRLFRLWAWWHPEQAQRLLGGEDNQELGVRLSLALLFLLVALSELVHLEPVLGAFMGGCVLSFAFRDKGQLEDKLSALGFGFLVPIFFIHVGLKFDLSNILGPGQVVFALKLLALALVVKVGPGLLFRFTGADWRQSLSAGFLLATRLSLIVAASAIGVQKGLLTPEIKDAIVLLALLTCLLGPTLSKVVLGKGPPGAVKG